MSSGSPRFPDPPKFSNAPRGYWAHEVDRLLSEVSAADRAGEPLAPIIGAAKLSEVGFGYDMDEVDAFLDQLRAGSVTTVSGSDKGEDSEGSPAGRTVPTPPTIDTTTTPEGAVLRRAARQQSASTPPTSGVSARAGQQPPHSELPNSNSSRTLSQATMLAEINRARLLPLAPPRESGYETSGVDRFLATLVDSIHAGQSILPALGASRFAMARRGSKGYDVGEVDELLDRLELLAAGDDDASHLTTWGANGAVPSAIKKWGSQRALASLAVGVAVVVLFLVLFGA